MSLQPQATRARGLSSGTRVEGEIMCFLGVVLVRRYLDVKVTLTCDLRLSTKDFGSNLAGLDQVKPGKFTVKPS